MTSNEVLVPISALQHMLYCPRQCALIHIERQWAENQFTAEGRILHTRVEAGKRETQGTLRIERTVPLQSRRLGVFGFADVVEVHDGGRPFPVEYKRGRQKAHRADEVQLCAQAICLEEMTQTPVPAGALFYGKARRRKQVVFDPSLRQLTEKVARDVRAMLILAETPAPEYVPSKCNSCSLESVCQPQKPRKSGHVARWLAQAIES